MPTNLSQHSRCPSDPDVVLATAGVATWSQLQEAGATRSLVRSRLASGRWWRPFRGVYVDGTAPPQPATYSRAAQLLIPYGVISHGTGLQLWGGTVQECVRASVEMTVPPEAPTVVARPGLIVHRASLDGQARTIEGGVTVTSPARTAADLARREAPGIGLATLDELLRKRLVSKDEINRCLAGMAHWRGIRTARKLAEMADGRSGSAMESLARWMFAEAGLPAPEIQYSFYDEDGEVFAVVDFFWKKARLVVEYDGWDSHMGDRRLFNNDRYRQNKLLAAGVRILRFTAADIYRRPRQMIAMIRAALAG